MRLRRLIFEHCDTEEGAVLVEGILDEHGEFESASVLKEFWLQSHGLRVYVKVVYQGRYRGGGGG